MEDGTIYQKAMKRNQAGTDDHNGYFATRDR